ncbi:MAG: hypothetical protein COU31_03295 [Candidatus Magasanikbacteria bacterium CG10_big_fil_rev_8_21_14_0_10_40_10]|uniref:Uncharacterized protein n=1 Tax=Candidatus Magasanikbacteria bacterium CG10_big_fil_rev_8_21_14_0_10_40_10 TaxID=1974648 RepID=A0A2M6W3H3_9BACT|nr:MAG: hypothetical protein COU31_03295 [Candidatus Magasanikbacteria bacterium CG10_big_fil_rev_8_21_14_0_10_40_10]
MNIIIFQRLLLEVIFDLLYFPIWWYSRGMAHAVVWCGHLFFAGNSVLAPGLWLKNIFVPMYGQYEWRGRLISFFVRLVNIIARALLLALWLIFSFSFFVIWLALPLLMIYSLIMVRESI